jgi:hypothetical protein
VERIFEVNKNKYLESVADVDSESALSRSKSDPLAVFLYLQSPDLPLMENCQEVVVRVCSESYSFLRFWARRVVIQSKKRTTFCQILIKVRHFVEYWSKCVLSSTCKM